MPLIYPALVKWKSLRGKCFDFHAALTMCNVAVTVFVIPKKEFFAGLKTSGAHNSSSCARRDGYPSNVSGRRKEGLRVGRPKEAGTG